MIQACLDAASNLNLKSAGPASNRFGLDWIGLDWIGFYSREMYYATVLACCQDDNEYTNALMSLYE